MSKERLEEIKQRLVLLHNASDVDDETKNYIFKDLKVEWLIERVQELEEENRKLNFEIGSYAMRLSEISQMVDREMNEMKKLSSRMLKGESK